MRTFQEVCKTAFVVNLLCDFCMTQLTPLSEDLFSYSRDFRFFISIRPSKEEVAKRGEKECNDKLFYSCSSAFDGETLSMNSFNDIYFNGFVKITNSSAPIPLASKASSTISPIAILCL